MRTASSEHRPRLALARHDGAAGLRLKSVLLTTDYVPEAIVEFVERLWRCTVYNHYGMTEMGLGGGVECQARRGYHLREADLYFEIVNPQTEMPVVEGETGEVVFTTLTRRGMPLIRYVPPISVVSSRQMFVWHSLENTRVDHHARRRLCAPWRIRRFNDGGARRSDFPDRGRSEFYGIADVRHDTRPVEHRGEFNARIREICSAGYSGCARHSPGHRTRPWPSDHERVRSSICRFASARQASHRRSETDLRIIEQAS